MGWPLGRKVYVWVSLDHPQSGLYREFLSPLPYARVFASTEICVGDNPTSPLHPVSLYAPEIILLRHLYSSADGRINVRQLDLELVDSLDRRTRSNHV